MRRSASGPYVCWKCLSRGNQSGSALIKSAQRARNPNTHTIASSVLRPHGGFHRSYASLSKRTHDQNGNPLFRERLRQWEAANPPEPPKGVPYDGGELGQMRNLLNRTSHAKYVDLDTSELDEPITDSGEVYDVVSPSDYGPGDLLDLTDDATLDSCLAICLGYINGAFHLYTQDGRWRIVRQFKSRFIVPEFVKPAELEGVLAKIPAELLSYEAMVALTRTEFAPDRAAGGQLLAKMSRFLRSVEEVTQSLGVTLDRIHSILTKECDNRYLTLQDMYTALSKNINNPNNPIALYAVYRAVRNNAVCFREVGTIRDSKTYLWEVLPASDITLVQNIQTLVRTTLRGSQLGDKLPSSPKAETWSESSIGSFILQARRAIDQSRKFRDFTPYGMVGPAKKYRPPFTAAWSSTDMSILHFMRLWVCYDQFPATSTYHWIGSAILRATGKYTDSEYLSTTVGWTFLQEVGYISPWDLHTRHLKRLPGLETSRVRGFEPLRLAKPLEAGLRSKDVFEPHERRDWKDLRAYAIDSEDTVDVDDAVSIELTDTSEEAWIHIHVADPASRVIPDSVLAKRAEQQPLTLYLSGHQTNMWGLGSELRDLFSLAPNNPCLTFSGKIDLQGNILEYKITPGVLRDFVYMTPEETNEAVGDHDANISKKDCFSVGKPPTEKPAGRSMTAAADLKPEDLKSLKLLDQFAKALHKRRLAKGAMPLFPQQSGVTAQFEDESISVQTIPNSKKGMEGTLHCNGDPFIKLSWPTEGSLLVASTMRLAGEIAAKWSEQRGIPLPFITQPEAQKNLAVLKSYTENVFYPMLLRGETIKPEQSGALFRLLGPDQMSATPGPHFLMGVDGYAKVTSPLRRYSDLLAHWQIEHALKQEMETGKVNRDDLPFRHDVLESKIFPWMRLRQRIIRDVDKRKGQIGYVLQALVRAWKYPDEYSTPLPETFRFTVRSRLSHRNRDMMGVLDWYNVPAKMSIDKLFGLGLQAADVSSGDEFEVRLTNVNVHLEIAYVEAVSKIKVAALDQTKTDQTQEEVLKS